MLLKMDFDLERFKEGNPQVLMDFYQSLGWDSKTHSIDPTKIKLSVNDAQQLMTCFMSGFPQKEKGDAGMFLVDKGPSNDESVPQGQVLLEEGWIIAES